MKESIDWNIALNPLLKKYKNKKHPLAYNSIYELFVMVVLSAQSSDKLINDIAPALFNVFPDMEALSKATEETLHPLITKVINHRNKASWLMKVAQSIKSDKKIPLTMDELVALPGIGRKSANVIMREAKQKAEGVIVDLHVLRVAPRLGIASSADPKIMEKEIMEKVDAKYWGETGMAISFLGRETCRPTDPKHMECVMNHVCAYFSKLKTGKQKK